MTDEMFLKKFAMQVMSVKQSGKFDELNQIMSGYDLNSMPSIRILALLRMSFTIRNHLPVWEHILTEANRILAERGENVKQMLRGLSPDSRLRSLCGG